MRAPWITLAVLAQRFFRAEANERDNVLFEQSGIEEGYHSCGVVTEPSASVMVKHGLIDRIDRIAD